jgi:hypothetical protein
VPGVADIGDVPATVDIVYGNATELCAETLGQTPGHTAAKQATKRTSRDNVIFRLSEKLQIEQIERRCSEQRSFDSNIRIQQFKNWSDLSSAELCAAQYHDCQEENDYQQNME